MSTTTTERMTGRFRDSDPALIMLLSDHKLRGACDSIYFHAYIMSYTSRRIFGREMRAGR